MIHFKPTKNNDDDLMTTLLTLQTCIHDVPKITALF